MKARPSAVGAAEEKLAAAGLKLAVAKVKSPLAKVKLVLAPRKTAVANVKLALAESKFSGSGVEVGGRAEEVSGVGGEIQGLRRAAMTIRCQIRDRSCLDVRALRSYGRIETGSRGSSNPVSEGDSHMPDTKREADNLLVISFLSLRKAVGIIGLLLPFVVAFGKILLDGSGLETSISAYYYTVMRDVLVGSLCAIGVFLFSYRGYDRSDEIAGKIASVTAIAAALFPTNPNDALTGSWTGRIHFTSAVILFLMLACFLACPVSQDRSEEADDATKEEKKQSLRCLWPS